MAAHGARVAVLDLDRLEAEKTVAALPTPGLALACDVAVEAEVTEAAKAAVTALGGLDILVNNAGAGRGPFDSSAVRPAGGGVDHMSAAVWDQQLAQNLRTAFVTTKAAAPHLKARGGGAIVNIASMAGRRGLMYRVGYCSAKAGQIGMTYGLALELGRHNITVNAIAPGAVAGDRIDRVIKGQAEVRGVDVEHMRQSFVERSPLRRMSTPEDIAALAAFLCSDHARNISGQCIPVTAGEPAS